MPNVGAVPFDPTSPVGEVRLELGDTNSSPLDPPQASLGSYDYFSDDAILSFLANSNQSIARAVGKSIKQLALNFAMKGRSIKTDDLAIDNRSRGDSVLAIAKSWLDQADAEDAATVGDIFDVVPTGRTGRRTRPQFARPEDDGLREDPRNPGYFVL